MPSVSKKKRASIREKAKERLARNRIAAKQGLFPTKEGFTSARTSGRGLIRTALGLGRKKPAGTRKTRSDPTRGTRTDIIRTGETPAEKKARLKRENK